MLLLALDTTTRVCTVALGDEDKLRGEYLLNIKNTHSERLMPLIVSLLKDCGISKEELRGVAVSIGPGSFTGIRIGMATAKGLCQGLNIPAVGVMTLDALAEGCSFFPGLICPVLDARKNQLYTAIYRGGAEDPEMLHPPAALSVQELGSLLSGYEEEVIFVGDGEEKSREELKRILGTRYRQMPYASCFNRAALVLQKGLKIWQEKGPYSSYGLKAFYLRLPEAQRRLAEKRRGGPKE